MIPGTYRKQPAYLGNSEFKTFKGYRLGCCSFTLTVDRSAMEGWGEVMAYVCDCGWRSNREPDVIHTQKASWGFYGGDPDIYEYRCPDCGSEECGENEDPDLSFKATKRRKAIIRSHS